MTFIPFSDFVPVAPVPAGTIARYQGILEPDVIEMWQTQGYGMAANGFIKVIDPDYYRDMIGEYLPWPDMVPVLATGMGDIVVRVRDTYRVLQFRYARATGGVPSTLGGLSRLVQERSYLDEYLDYQPYAEAVQAYGPLTSPDDFNYIYAYKLALPAGGFDGVENLFRAEIFVNISITWQWTGPIPFAMAE